MKSGNTRGFSALEMVAVLAVVTVLGAVGFSSTSQMAPKYHTSKAAAEFNQAISLARQLAMTNNVETRILLVEFDSNASDASAPNKGLYRIQLGNFYKDSTSWDTVPLDPGPADISTGEGTYDLSASGHRHIPDISLEDWGLIDGPSTGNSDAIVFNPRGYLQNPMTDLDSEGGIAITFINKKTVGGEHTDRTSVRVYSGGMARTVAGGVQDSALASATDTGAPPAAPIEEETAVDNIQPARNDYYYDD